MSLGKTVDPFVRRRVALKFDPEESRTHQSFADECDIDQILGQFARTGVINHLNPAKPQYGEVPDLSLHEALCAQAEVRSYDEIAPEESEAAPDDETGSEEPESLEAEEQPPAASEAAERRVDVDQSA